MRTFTEAHPFFVFLSTVESDIIVRDGKIYDMDGSLLAEYVGRNKAKYR